MEEKVLAKEEIDGYAYKKVEANSNKKEDTCDKCCLFTTECMFFRLQYTQFLTCKKSYIIKTKIDV